MSNQNNSARPARPPVSEAEKSRILDILYPEGKRCSEYWAIREYYDWGLDGPFDWHLLKERAGL